MVCDFCSDPNPLFAFPAKPFEMQQSSVPTTKPTSGSKGSWAACGTCHDLIIHNDYKALALRSAKMMHLKNQGVPTSLLVKSFKKLHLQFKENRTGKPIRLTEEQRRSGTDPAMAEQAPIEVEFNEKGQLTNPEFRDAGPFFKTEPVMTRDEHGRVTAMFEEGLRPEQLGDPKVLSGLVQRVTGQRMDDPYRLVVERDPTRGLTLPGSWETRWEGARTYAKALGATVGENPRMEDMYKPGQAMVNARQMLYSLASAHPVVIDPEQMNALDDEDWSVAEAHDYARMAHLPFEPVYLDFGGHDKVMVDCALGQAQLFGALVWRDSNVPGEPLSVAPFGAFEYINALMMMYAIEQHGWSNERATKILNISTTPTQAYQPLVEHQWKYQSPGIVHFGSELTAPVDSPKFVRRTVPITNSGGTWDVGRMYGTPQALSALGEPRLTDDRSIAIVMATGLIAPELENLGDDGKAHLVEHLGTGWTVEQAVEYLVPGFTDMMEKYCELLAKMAERALLGLYFIENAPVEISQAPMSRQVRRAAERNGTKLASIVAIRPSSGGRRHEEPAESRDWEYCIERRGHFRHIHSNNRHYQNRPDLVKPCHRCEREYALGTEGVESADCIKQWIEPTIVGDRSKPLKQKVRVKRRKAA
jgi:hypothetical protein